MRPSPGDNATRRVSSSVSSRTHGLCRLTHRRHVKVGNPQRRHRRAGDPIAPLPRQRRLADAGLAGPSQQIQRALVEPEVVDRSRHFAVFDQVDAVAGQPGQQQRRRVRPRGCTTAWSAATRARSPRSCRPCSAPPPVIKTLSAATATGALEFGGRGARIGQRVDHTVADPVHPVDVHPVVEDRHRLRRTGGRHKWRTAATRAPTDPNTASAAGRSASPPLGFRRRATTMRVRPSCAPRPAIDHAR